MFCLDYSCVLQLLVLSSQSLLQGIGYYRIILYTFYLEAGLAALVLVLGPQHYYVLAVFLTLTMYVLQQLLPFLQFLAEELSLNVSFHMQGFNPSVLQSFWFASGRHHRYRPADVQTQVMDRR